MLTLQLEDRDGQRELAIPADLSNLREGIEAHEAKLVIIDPLVAYLGAGIKNNLAPPVPSLAYRLEDTGNGVARLRWEGGNEPY